MLNAILIIIIVCITAWVDNYFSVIIESRIRDGKDWWIEKYTVFVIWFFAFNAVIEIINLP